MRRRRCQVRGQAVIDAPIERVFDVASDPDMVPRYADEIARVDVLERRGDGDAIVRSVLKLASLRVPYRYRYSYRRPRMYAGEQQGGWLLRGYFAFSFKRRGEQTIVRHVEGLESRVPGLAAIAGFVYFRLLGRGNLIPELEHLAELVRDGEHSRESVNRSYSCRYVGTSSGTGGLRR